MKNTRAYGAEGEALAAEWLSGAGMEILERNFRAGRIGEIDLIAKDGETVCFIEVKRRSGDAYGSPAEAVTPMKQRRIRTVAECWLSRNGGWNRPVRFDVVEVIDTRGTAGFRHIRAAF